ncbi:hypothetical protein REPUB_Repub01dG0094200 [Reevesia pubescens]
MTLFSFAIYGLVIFSTIKGYVEIKVVNFFTQFERNCNLMPSILTKTFMSLSYYSRKEKKIVGCFLLLYVWLKSHFLCMMNVFSQSHSDNHAPI